MQYLPTVTRVSTVKNSRRHHQCSNTKQRSKVFHSAPRLKHTPKLSNVVATVEHINTTPSTSCLSVRTAKQRSANVSVIHVSRSETTLSTIGNKHRSDSQNNSFHRLMTKYAYNNDMQKPITSSNTFNNISSDSPTSFSHIHSKQTVISSSDVGSIDSKMYSPSRTDTTQNFHSKVDTWCTTSKGSLFDLRRQKLLNGCHDKEEKNEKRRRRRRAGCWGFCCPCCSPCCCLLTGILLALLLGGLAALIGVLITTKTKSTTSTTTTTTSSSTSTTTTSATTTSSSSSTSSSTSSTSTSSTSSTSTSSSSTSSTSTSSTSSTTTSITTISVTTVTTTTTAATVTITSNTCTSGWKGVTVLYHCDNCPNISPYQQFTYTYTAISNRTRIAFAFREDAGCFALDNVSVRSTATPTVEVLANNDFETGTLSSWTYCNPKGATSAGEVKQNSDNFLCMSYIYQAKSGTNFYYDGAVGACDYLIQTFSTIIGSTYTISYWLYNRGSGTASSADVIISI